MQVMLGIIGLTALFLLLYLVITLIRGDEQ